jgi:hypothetical protein
VPCEVLAAGLEIAIENLLRGSIDNPPVANVPCNRVNFDSADMTLSYQSVRNDASFWTLRTSARADIKPPLASAHGSFDPNRLIFVCVSP